MNNVRTSLKIKTLSKIKLSTRIFVIVIISSQFVFSQQSILLNSNLTKQFHYFEKKDLSDNTQKPNGLNNGNLIWITDVSVNYRINHIPQRIESGTYLGEAYKNTYDNGGRFYFTSDLGALKKINKNIGFGISHYLGIGNELRTGIKLKYRQWLKNGSYFDISPGIIYFDFGERAPGFISSIDWCKNKYFALTALIEYLPSKTDILDAHVIEYEKDFGVYFGIKVLIITIQ